MQHRKYSAASAYEASPAAHGLFVCFVVQSAGLLTSCAVGYSQWLKWFCEAGGLTRRSQVGANPIPIPTPLIWRYLGIEITLYRFNQGGSYYCRGLKWSRG